MIYRLAEINITQAIACIGWGSLVYSPRDLPFRGVWQFDGPVLPVEFARESADRRITLVICPSVPRVQTCWTLLDVSDIEGLREHRQAKPRWLNENIGFWDRATQTSFGLESDAISKWAETRGLAGAVWTNLPCKFNNSNGVMPTAEQVVTHLGSLQGEEREAAELYIRKAPAQIDLIQLLISMSDSRRNKVADHEHQAGRG